MSIYTRIKLEVNYYFLLKLAKNTFKRDEKYIYIDTYSLLGVEDSPLEQIEEDPNEFYDYTTYPTEVQNKKLSEIFKEDASKFNRVARVHYEKIKKDIYNLYIYDSDYRFVIGIRNKELLRPLTFTIEAYDFSGIDELNAKRLSCQYVISDQIYSSFAKKISDYVVSFKSYELSKLFLKPVANSAHPDETNDYATSLRNSHNYEESQKYYIKSNCNIALWNICTNYLSGNLPLDKELFLSSANELIKRGDAHGYSLMASFYNGETFPEEENWDEWFQYAKLGYQKFPNSYYQELDYMIARSATATLVEHHAEAYKLAKAIKSKAKNKSEIIQINYVICLAKIFGYGCKKDYSGALELLKDAPLDNPRTSKLLSIIYSKGKKHKNLELAKKYEQIRQSLNKDIQKE